MLDRLMGKVSPAGARKASLRLASRQDQQSWGDPGGARRPLASLGRLSEVADRLAAGARGESGPDRRRDAVGDEPDGAVAEGRVDAAGVPAAGGGPGVAVSPVAHAEQGVGGRDAR